MIVQSGPDIAGLSNDKALDLIGQLIDDAFDKKSAADTALAFSLMETLEDSGQLTPEQFIVLCYFRANAWENRIYENAKTLSWEWDFPEVQNQILELRRAVGHKGFSDQPLVRRCQINTNLAGKLNSIGRFVEAIEYWDRAIEIEPRFAMAQGNKGRGLQFYAGALYDPGHAGVFLAVASNAFGAAAAKDAIFDSPANEIYEKDFSDAKSQIEQEIDVAAALRILGGEEHSIGRSAVERGYRTWCLENRLFVSPLNDLGANRIAAQDVLTLPSITLPLSDTPPSGLPPVIIGFFNQLKQEFVSARFLFFEGIRASKPHFSDKGVLLYSTLDYSSYAFGAEKMRAAYRLAYSLFDKIAYFLNHYLAVGYPDERVNFRNVWYEHKGSDPKPLRAMFTHWPNWPLRGLYWLSKDLFDPEFKAVTEPDAEALAEIRNHLEHKYLQLHESWAWNVLDEKKTQNRFGYHIGRDEFAAKTLRVLKLARNALIYLSLAVHCEERLRHSGNPDKLVGPLPLHRVEDGWKL